MRCSIEEYIETNLPKCIRENKEDSGTLIGLPYPYIVPCASGAFQEMYYWDTYFTNKGLILCGNVEQARNNIDNMCYMIEKYGFVLNGNRTTYLHNSQPPFLSMMARDVYEVAGDKEWLKKVYPALEKEHAFWSEKRGSEIGLNRYDCMPLQGEERRNAAVCLRGRIGEDVDCGDEETAARGLISAGESGWDPHL